MANKKQTGQTSEPTEAEKKLAYYSALVSAFTETSIAKDNNLLMLSAGGLGILVTLLSTVGVSCAAQLLIYFVGSLSFLTSIILLLIVLEKNKDLLIKIKEGKQPYPSLGIYDRFVMGFFLAGIVCALIISMSIGIEQLTKKRGSVMEDEKTTQSSDKELLKESFNGIDKMGTGKKTEKKSLDKIEKMGPDTNTSKDTTKKK